MLKKEFIRSNFIQKSHHYYRESILRIDGKKNPSDIFYREDCLSASKSEN